MSAPTRRLVIDLASPRAAWRIPQERVAEITAAMGTGWEVTQIGTPAVSDGDGAYGSGSPESIAAARGAEVYFGYGVPRGVADAGRGTLRWAHTGRPASAAAWRMSSPPESCSRTPPACTPSRWPTG